MKADAIRIGISGNLFNSSGRPTFGEAPLEMFAEAGLQWEVMPARVSELNPDTIAGFDALYIAGERLTQASLAGGSDRLQVVARHGVGYDAIDVAALTRCGILLTNTPIAIRHPVASATMALILALSLKLPLKSRLAREGRWHERADYTGTSLPGRTLGIIGIGGIGRELVRLMQPFGMRVIGADPYVTQDQLASKGIELKPFESVVAESDFLVITCPFDQSTYHLVDSGALSLMKPTAYLVNVARGPIIDEKALIEVLAAGKLAGAALDVFEQEPVDPANPLLAMENVIATPHSLSWTDGFADAVARSAIKSIVDTFQRRMPEHIVNRDVLAHSRMEVLRAGKLDATAD
jgi:phosphoglycerate dehydrogenase-like enzyme